MAAEAEVFHYEPHPRIAERKQTPPPKVDDEHVGFNGRVGCENSIGCPRVALPGSSPPAGPLSSG